MQNLQQIKELGSSLTVLYAEDDNSIRENFAVYLQKFFKEVKVCVDGYEALEAYKVREYDIVITDIMMPNLNGVQMSREIKKLNPTQNIIVVSSYSDMDFYLEFIKIGIDGYILKPIDFEQMNQALFKAIQIITQAKQNEQYKVNLEAMVSEKTKELQQLYITDSLTGLYNRVYLDQRLQMDCHRSLLLLDIDNFSMITDNYGFDVADLVLKKIAKILELLQDTDYKLFRVQKDEFAFLLPQRTAQEAEQFAQKIKDYFESNFIDLENLHVAISFTMGIDSGRGDDLLKNASMSIHEIREFGKNLIKIYDKNSNFEVTQKENIYWYSKLKNMMKENSLIPYFQPIVDIKTEKIYKYEALARMSDNGEIITPDKFLPPAKASGIIHKLTKIMIEKSFEAIQKKDIQVSINITEQDLKEEYLFDFLSEKVKEFGIEARNVTLEILESISLSKSQTILSQLAKLKEAGFQLAIDDFGTENSNFSRLLRVNVDYIKVDGLFIKNIDIDVNSQKIALAIVTLAHSIGAKVIAEFVHSKEVYEKVKELGFDYAQGYYLGVPKPTL